MDEALGREGEVGQTQFVDWRRFMEPLVVEGIEIVLNVGLPAGK